MAFIAAEVLTWKYGRWPYHGDGNNPGGRQMNLMLCDGRPLLLHPGCMHAFLHTRPCAAVTASSARQHKKVQSLKEGASCTNICSVSDKWSCCVWRQAEKGTHLNDLSIPLYALQDWQCVAEPERRNAFQIIPARASKRTPGITLHWALCANLPQPSLGRAAREARLCRK